MDKDASCSTTIVAVAGVCFIFYFLFFFELSVPHVYRDIRCRLLSDISAQPTFFATSLNGTFREHSTKRIWRTGRTYKNKFQSRTRQIVTLRPVRTRYIIIMINDVKCGLFIDAFHRCSVYIIQRTTHKR